MFFLEKKAPARNAGHEHTGFSFDMISQKEKAPARNAGHEHNGFFDRVSQKKEPLLGTPARNTMAFFPWTCFSQKKKSPC